MQTEAATFTGQHRSRLFWLSVLALTTAAVSASLRAAIASSLKAQWIDPIAPVEAGELIGAALGSPDDAARARALAASFTG